MWSYPEVVQYTIGTPSTEQRTWMRVLSYIGHWHFLSFGYWAVEEISSGKFVGEVGFADFKRDVSPWLRGIPEMGWVISPEFQGRGYATEALGAALKWGDKNLPTQKTVCFIHPRNEASLRVAQKLDFKEIAETTLNGEPSKVFERTPLKSI